MPCAPHTHVFIVDDSASIRGRLTEMLARIDDVRVVGEAGNSKDAVAGILRTHPHSVLLDLDLMGSSGIDVLRAVHPQAPDIVFIVLTNHSETQYRRVCAAAGASYFFDKSSEFEQVRDLIADLASSRH